MGNVGVGWKFGCKSISIIKVEEVLNINSSLGSSLIRIVDWGGSRVERIFV